VGGAALELLAVTTRSCTGAHRCDYPGLVLSDRCLAQPEISSGNGLLMKKKGSHAMWERKVGDSECLWFWKWKIEDERERVWEHSECVSRFEQTKDGGVG
jgi:hypothetical protein